MHFDIKPKKKFLDYCPLYSLITIIVLLLFISVLLKYSIDGYTINKEFNKLGLDATELVNEVSITTDKLNQSTKKLNSCNADIKTLMIQKQTIQNKSNACILENEELKQKLSSSLTKLNNNLTSTISDYTQQINLLNSQINLKNTEISDIKSSFKELVSNSAKNICCKAQVDNPEINSYFISNNKIICSINAENAITC